MGVEAEGEVERKRGLGNGRRWTDEKRGTCTLVGGRNVELA